MGQILLVDDDPDQLRIRELVLRSAGFSVHVATSAESALAMMRPVPEKIGLVVTDHVLPGITGAEMVREMRSWMCQTPVLVLSGMPGIEEEYNGLQASIQMKPMAPAELLLTVGKLLPQPSN
jgi:DNA-binding response OmpR family regulator